VATPEEAVSAQCREDAPTGAPPDLPHPTTRGSPCSVLPVRAKSGLRATRGRRAPRVLGPQDPAPRVGMRLVDQLTQEFRDDFERRP